MEKSQKLEKEYFFQIEMTAKEFLLQKYTVSQIKTPMRTIVHNFVKFLPIFTIFWLADSAGNL